MGRADLTTPKLLLLVNLSCSFALVWFVAFGSAAATPILHPEEVKALKAIGKKLGKKDWDFGVDPCSGKGNWIAQGDEVTSYASNVTCDCSFNNNKTCHVVSMYCLYISINSFFFILTNLHSLLMASSCFSIFIL